MVWCGPNGAYGGWVVELSSECAYRVLFWAIIARSFNWPIFAECAWRNVRNVIGSRLALPEKPQLRIVIVEIPRGPDDQIPTNLFLPVLSHNLYYPSTNSSTWGAHRSHIILRLGSLNLHNYLTTPGHGIV